MQQQQLPQRRAFCKVGSMFTANELDVGGKVFVLLGTKYSLAENQPASQQPFPVKSRSRFNFVGKGNNQLVSVFVYYFIDSPGENFLQLLQRDEKKRFAFFTVQGSPRGRQRLNKHSTESPALFRDGLLRSSSRGKPSNINYPPVFGTSAQLVVPLRTHAEPNTQNRGVAQLNWMI